MPTYKLLNRGEYFDELIRRYNTAQSGDRIILATMEFRPDTEKIAEIVSGLCVAARAGARVTFIVDAYSFMLKDGSVLGPLFFTKRIPARGYGHFKKVIASIKQMEAAGVECVIINRPTRAFKNPFSGRSHIKFAIYNDIAFIGGCNLSHPDQLDVMVQTKNSKIAEHMEDFTARVIKHKNVKRALNKTDEVIEVAKDTHLLIDSGVRRQSVIYDQAFQLIKNAREHIYMTCQYFPNHDTPAALAEAADKGVVVHLAYNHPRKHRVPIGSVQHHTIAYKKKRLPLSIFENQLDYDKNYLHAKILANEKEAIIGSHNYVAIGVRWGTAEIALHSTSPNFIKQAQQWVKNI